MRGAGSLAAMIVVNVVIDIGAQKDQSLLEGQRKGRVPSAIPREALKATLAALHIAIHIDAESHALRFAIAIKHNPVIIQVQLSGNDIASMPSLTIRFLLGRSMPLALTMPVICHRLKIIPNALAALRVKVTLVSAPTDLDQPRRQQLHLEPVNSAQPSIDACAHAH
ncbi:hypothetical protein GGI06_001101 [Coemansia sp. S85]|nr:hypothetical protein GGI06_001101 [Coemansia sp. S85]